MMLQLMGWAPDLDPTTPGVMTSTTNILPRADGFGVLPTPSALTPVSTIPGFVRSWAIARSGNVLHTVVAAYGSQDSGTATTCTLYEINGQGAVTARASCTASTFTEPVILRQFDNAMYAARAGYPLRFAPPLTDFTAITGSPECSLLESTKDFLIAFNTEAGFDWHCSAIGDPLDWALSVSNQCVRGKFFEKSGPIVAAGRYGEAVLAFTRSQTWVGRYVGAPEVWQWEQISREVGCVGPEAVEETPAGLCFVGLDNVYIFNGATITPLNTEGVRRTLFGDSSSDPGAFIARALIGNSQLVFDKSRQLLWLFYQYGSLWNRGQAVAYHFITQRWGTAFIPDYRAASQLAQPDYSYGTSSGTDLLYFNGPSSNNGLYRIGNDAGTGNGSITTGWVGDVQRVSMVRAVRPKFSRSGGEFLSYLNLTSRLKAIDYGAVTAATASTLTADSSWLARQTGRWHRATINLRNRDVLHSIDWDVVPKGTR